MAHVPSVLTGDSRFFLSPDMLRRVYWYLITDVSGQAYRSHIQGSTLKMGPIGFPETSLAN